MIHECRAAYCSGQRSYDDCLQTCRAVDEDAAAGFIASIKNDDPMLYAHRELFEYERFIAIRPRGVLSPATGTDAESGDLLGGKGDEIAVMYLDRFGAIEDGGAEVFVGEMKTGRRFVDDPVERETYVLGARAAFPREARFRFDYFYPRIPRRITWRYEYLKANHVLVTAPDGSQTELKGRSNPLLERLYQRIAQLEGTEPVPRAGHQCENWFGAPCQFLGAGCPIGESISVSSACGVSPDSPIAPFLPSQTTTPGASFLAIQRGLPLADISPEHAGLAYQAIQHLKAGTALVENILREWAGRYGPIPLGDSHIGWRDYDRVVITDVEAALKMLLASGWSAAVKGININAASLGRLGTRDWNDLAARIKRVCGEVVHERKFGVVQSSGVGADECPARSGEGTPQNQSDGGRH